MKGCAEQSAADAKTPSHTADSWRRSTLVRKKTRKPKRHTNAGRPGQDALSQFAERESTQERGTSSLTPGPQHRPSDPVGK